MSAPVHSKGPWKIDGEFDADIAVSIQDADGIDVCEYYPAGYEWTPEDIRNARLIESAPTMFEVLEKLLPGFASGSSEAIAIAVLIARVTA